MAEFGSMKSVVSNDQIPINSLESVTPAKAGVQRKLRTGFLLEFIPYLIRGRNDRK